MYIHIGKSSPLGLKYGVVEQGQWAIIEEEISLEGCHPSLLFTAYSIMDSLCAILISQYLYPVPLILFNTGNSTRRC